jgi:outer membrane protein assembly factor BamE
MRGHYVRLQPATPDTRTPEDRMALHRSLALALLAAATLLSGCVYRPDIQQGNLLTVEDTDQVQVGMSRSQVRFLLGTPMISDPFAPHRWDYVYRMRYGRGGRVDSAHFVVFFEDDKVVRVETRGRPVPVRVPVEQQKKQPDKLDDAAMTGQEPPPAPAVETKLPGTPEPGT